MIRKCLEIGRSLLSRILDGKSNSERDVDNALAAVGWLSKGLELLDSKQGTAQVAKSISHLKVRQRADLEHSLMTLLRRL